MALISTLIDFISKHASELVSAAGAFGSIAGAFVAYKQYRKAASSAASAKESEFRLVSLMKKNEMSRTIQRIKDIVERLSKYTQRGRKYTGGPGLILTDDIDKAIALRHDLASVEDYAERYKTQLEDIKNAATSINFKKANDDERVEAIGMIIEGFNAIALYIDKAVSNND